MSNAVRTAVILAAGMGTRLGKDAGPGPKGFLRLGALPIIEEAIERLRNAGIERVIIVTGHQSTWYEDLAKRSGGYVTTLKNSHYQRSGSMYSLYCAREFVDEDFLLLESDLVFEQHALDLVLSCEQPDCILLSTLTNSHDEVFVETDNDNLVSMSKNRRSLGSVSGELVGITKVSPALFAQMSAFAADAFVDSLMVDYETDGLVAVAKRYPIHCHPATDLAWAEIDDVTHLRRARESVYAEILRRDARAV